MGALTASRCRALAACFAACAVFAWATQLLAVHGLFSTRADPPQPHPTPHEPSAAERHEQAMLEALHWQPKQQLPAHSIYSLSARPIDREEDIPLSQYLGRIVRSHPPSVLPPTDDRQPCRRPPCSTQLLSVRAHAGRRWWLTSPASAHPCGPPRPLTRLCSLLLASACRSAHLCSTCWAAASAAGQVRADGAQLPRAGCARPLPQGPARGLRHPSLPLQPVQAAGARRQRGGAGIRAAAGRAVPALRQDGRQRRRRTPGVQGAQGCDEVGGGRRRHRVELRALPAYSPCSWPGFDG